MGSGHPPPPLPVGWPVESEGQLGPGHCYSWAGSGDLALRKLPTEICLLLVRTGPSWGEGGALEPCLFLLEQNNICLVEVYRNIITWLWPDLKNKGSDRKKFTTHVPPSPFLEKGFAESLWGVQAFLRHELQTSLQGLVINLSLPQSRKFWYRLASLFIGHTDLCFRNMSSMQAKLLQSCLTLCHPMDCSPPGSSVHRVFQEKYWSGLPCPPPGDQNHVSCISCTAGRFFTPEPQGKPNRSRNR